jgi:hypothetical protein
MAVGKLSINDLPIDNVLGALLHDATPNKEPIDPQQPNLTCTPDPTKTKAYRQVVGVENAWWTVYGKVSGWYNKHRKYSEQWNRCHPFRTAHNIQQAQSFSPRTKTWIDQHLRCGQYNIKPEFFQSADAIQPHFPQLDYGLGDDSRINDDSHIFGTLYYRVIVKCIQLLIANLPFQANLDFKPLRLPYSEGCRIYSEMNLSHWWRDAQDRLPAGVTTVPVIG